MSARTVGIGALAGLCGAVLIDLYLVISEPWVAKHVTALLVMQWDASNALGAAAYRGGWATAALGTLMHFAVSIVWGILFVFAALRIRGLQKHALTGGIVLGVVAMGVMRLVIHLGHAVVRPFPSPGMFLYILVAHVVFFGIPVALVATNLLTQRPGIRKIRV
ncbi:MAG TPA: hypothetical protein VIX83_09630 [Candidatus Cybelea sp.]